MAEDKNQVKDKQKVFNPNKVLNTHLANLEANEAQLSQQIMQINQELRQGAIRMDRLKGASLELQGRYIEVNNQAMALKKLMGIAESEEKPTAGDKVEDIPPPTKLPQSEEVPEKVDA